MYEKDNLGVRPQEFSAILIGCGLYIKKHKMKLLQFQMMYNSCFFLVL